MFSRALHIQHWLLCSLCPLSLDRNPFHSFKVQSLPSSIHSLYTFSPNPSCDTCDLPRSGAYRKVNINSRSSTATFDVYYNIIMRNYVYTYKLCIGPFGVSTAGHGNCCMQIHSSCTYTICPSWTFRNASVYFSMFLRL